MSFPGSQAYAHATIEVDDLEAARAFCVDVLGLVELDTTDDAVYLGCGYDEAYDLALKKGSTGVDHFALRVFSTDLLEDAAKRLGDLGLKTERRSDAEPGEREALRFELPSGHLAELVITDQKGQIETYRPAHRVNAVAPIDADHINLMAADVKGLADVLCGALDLRCSDITQNPDGGEWIAAWLRLGQGHHDVGIMRSKRAGESLHHVAFAYSGIDHLKVALDALAAAGHKLEIGLGRHPVGANLFAYLWTPGGNRFELCAEGAILAEDTPARTWADMSETLNAWSDQPPPATFGAGS